MWSFRRKPKPADAVVPPMSFWDGLENKFTPDLNILEMSEYQRVFVCDELMKPHFRHHVMKDIIGNEDPLYAITRQVFGMVRRQMDHTVVPLRRRFANVSLARVKGELYAVRSSKIPILDELKQNGLLFRRERVRLLLPYRTLTSVFDANERDLYEHAARLSPYKETAISAWMYIGNAEYWEQVLLQHQDERDGMIYFSKKYAMRENGLFLPKTVKHYRQVKIYTPNNKQQEKYYYHTRDQLRSG